MSLKYFLYLFNSIFRFPLNHYRKKESERKRKEEQQRKTEIEMVLVVGGEYEMGETEETVEVESFYIGKYPITQKQWEEVMGTNPSEFKGDDLPVESVSWHDAQKFIEKLNERTGKYYRLPTEAEWEWAARGGEKSKGYTYSGSNNLNSVGWYSENSDEKTHPVGRKKPNELGIHDMSGNVWEWCEDWYDDDRDTKVIRGGSWHYEDIICSVFFRLRLSTVYGYYNDGLRIAHDL